MSSYSKALRERRELELRLLVEAMRRAEAGNDYAHKNYYAKMLTRKLAYYGYVITEDYTLHPNSAYDKLDRDKATIRDLEEQLEALKHTKAG